MSKAKVAVFTCGLDIAQTETKGTVLLKSAAEMLDFSNGEEAHMERVRLHVFSTSSLDFGFVTDADGRFSKKLPILASSSSLQARQLENWRCITWTEWIFASSKFLPNSICGASAESSTRHHWLAWVHPCQKKLDLWTL